MIKITYKRLYLSFFSFATCLMLFGYIGIFTKYRLIPSYCYFVFLVFLLLIKKINFKLDKYNAILVMLIVYISFSALINNRLTGFDYLIFLCNGILLSRVKLEPLYYKKILRFFLAITFIFAVFTIWNNYDKEIIIKLFGSIIHEAQLKTIKMNLVYGGVPGLAGETSYNAFVLSFGIVIILAKILGYTKMTAKDFVMLSIILIALIITGKRSLILSTLALVIIVLLLYVKEKYKMNNIYYFILIGSFLLIISPFILQAIFDVFSKGGETVDLSNRDWFWQMALDMFESNPIFGQGINTYDFVYNANKTGLSYVSYAGAHNSYIQYLAELGLVGLMLLLFLCASNFKFAVKQLFNNNLIVTNERKLFRFLLTFSVLGQCLIFLYAFSENPFYQPQQIMFYFFLISISHNLYFHKKI